MTLTLQITRTQGQDTQVRCVLDDNPLNEFYGCGEFMTDTEIEEYVRVDLMRKGYPL